MNGEHALAQLRHLYAQMLSGNVKDCETAAHGLLGPAIEALEVERRHIATLEKERNAALADNAVVLSALRAAREALGKAQANIGWGTQPRLECGRAYDAAGAVLVAPHPSAALLEEHSKALVRARDEGLEKVAKDFMLRSDVATEYGHRHTAEAWRNAASAVRAMKEPE